MRQLSLLKEHSFLAESSEWSLNMPIGLRSKTRFLIFVLQIQVYGLCQSITLKKNKRKAKRKKMHKIICITAVNRLAPRHMKTPYHTAGI